MKELEFLEEQNVSEDLIHGVEEFRKIMALMKRPQPESPDRPFRSMEKKSWKWLLQDFWKGKISSLQVRKPPEKISWPKIWLMLLAARSIMYRFMSTQTAGISSERTRL